MGSSSSNSSGREPTEVCPPPSDFQDISDNPSLRVKYRDLAPMTRLFTSHLPISEVDQKCLADFIQGWNIPWSLHPKCKNCRHVEGLLLLKIITALQWAVGKDLPTRSQPTAIFEELIPILGSLSLGQIGWLSPMTRPLSELIGFKETPRKCPWCWPGYDLWAGAYGGQVGPILPSKWRGQLLCPLLS